MQNMNNENWIKTDDGIPKCKNGIFKVRLKNGEETRAYFYLDKISWIAFYGQKTSYWWKCPTGEPLFNVTHWFNNNLLGGNG